MKTTKSIKFHSSENVGKRNELVDFLTECRNVANKLIELNFGCFIETNKFSFITNTQLYNLGFKVRSHHYQHIQTQAFNIIILRYDEIVSKIKFENKYLNYLKFFYKDFDKVEDYLNKQISKVKDQNKVEFFNEVLNYWRGDRENIEIHLKKSIIEEIRKSKIPKIKKLTIGVDSRTSSFQDSEDSKKFKKWFEIRTNELVDYIHYKRIFIPIKWSKYHEKILQGKVLNNSFIVKYDEVYERLEIIGSYDEEITPKTFPQPDENNSLGIDVGYTNLMTISDGQLIVNEKKIKRELEKLLIYEKQVNRLRKRKQYESTKYQRTQKKISNQVENFLNRELKTLISNNPQINHLIFENLEYIAKGTKEFKQNFERMRIRGLITKVEKRKFDLGVDIHKVDPSYTSQECPTCSFTDKSNRNGIVFKCKNCGHEDHADLNAAKNIKARFFDHSFEGLNQGEIKNLLNKRFEAYQVAHNASSQLSQSIGILGLISESNFW